MKFGFIQVYNEANWIGYAVDQAMKLCDKVLIVEGSQFADFSDIAERSDDGTLDIIADKKKQYPKRIEDIKTIREHGKYRLNQCANFNRGLTFCAIGDYFILLDADDFYPDEWISEVDELMREGEVSLIKVLSYDFAFSFSWRIKRGEIKSERPVIVKKTREFYFAPTHNWINSGVNVIVIPHVVRYHYGWLKPRERMRTRMRTSKMYPDMVNWFDENWDNIKLENSKEQSHYAGKFTLSKYDGEHPSVLDNHPWRHVEDIRRLRV